MKRLLKTGAIACFAMWIGTTENFASRQLGIPSYLGKPGDIVSIPITLNNAAAVASVHLQVNYNPQILEFVGARNDGLGAAFELTYSGTDGVVTVMLNRSTSLVAGSGRLAVLQFRVNAGAQAGLSSDLALAVYELTDDSGVRSTNLAESVTATNGQIAVTLGTVDNNSDKIPDAWEAAYGLSTIDPNTGDTDGDGVRDLLEYALGMNPTISDLKGLPLAGKAITNGVEHLTIQFHRRIGAALDYLVEESGNLTSWNSIDQTTHMIGAPIDLGDGFEQVKIHGDIPLSGAARQPRGFMRLRVNAQ